MENELSWTRIALTFPHMYTVPAASALSKVYCKEWLAGLPAILRVPKQDETRNPKKSKCCCCFCVTPLGYKCIHSSSCLTDRQTDRTCFLYIFQIAETGVWNIWKKRRWKRKWDWSEWSVDLLSQVALSVNLLLLFDSIAAVVLFLPGLAALSARLERVALKRIFYFPCFKQWKSNWMCSFYCFIIATRDIDHSFKHSQQLVVMSINIIIWFSFLVLFWMWEMQIFCEMELVR